MDTRLATNQIRLQQWADIIRDRKESGLKVNDYCKLHNLSRNAYYYWLKKLRTKALESSAVTFAELPSLSFSNQDSAAAPISVHIHDAVVHVHENATGELLAVVLEVLKDVK